MISRLLFHFLALFFLYAALPKSASAQQVKTIRGVVTDAQGKALAGASVYLSQTSIGVTTSNTGDFHLQILPDGKYDLVVSAIGYESKIIPISSSSYPASLKISSSIRATDLDEVIVEPADKNGWQKFGRYFTSNFIGTTSNAKHCRIIDREILKFRYSEKNNRLTVKADDAITIINKSLGYRISFRLVEFIADFNENTVVYYGYPFFTDLKEVDEKARQTVVANRRQAFYGSLMHFLRAVYADNLDEERYTVRATIRSPNREKERVRKALAYADSNFHRSRYKITDLSRGLIHVTSNDDTISIADDSLRYYRNVLREPDTSATTESLTTLNEIIVKPLNSGKLIYFDNSMEVIFNGNEYTKRSRSEIKLRTPEPVEIMKNGSYFSPTELITFKHWSVYEKMCNMLPLDYVPE